MNELFWDEDYKFVKRIITFVTATFVIISTCVGFIFTFSAYETVNVNKHQIEFLFDNWQHNYITDIITIRNSTCPVGYESILNTTWQGTVEGWLHIVRQIKNKTDYFLAKQSNYSLSRKMS